jgi:tRNA dimethylallyltransferase
MGVQPGGDCRIKRAATKTMVNSSIIPPGLVVIGGATATGKSGLALALAKRLAVAILSADSRQVYREFDIGTAKPSLLEQKQAPHYLIDICDPADALTLADYQQQAQQILQHLHQAGQQLPLLVGGSGLYIDAVVKGLRIPPVAPHASLRGQLASLGQSQCYAMLQQLDPAASRLIHPNDKVRTTRALEVFYVSGQPMTTLQGEQPPHYPMLYLGLDCPPDTLAQRIQQRTEDMVAAGLVAEVSQLADRYGPDLPLMQTLGYAEMLRHLQGDISLAEARADTVQHTRQFAKRQRTWFRNRARVQWFDAQDPDLVDQVWATIMEWLESIKKLE